MGNENRPGKGMWIALAVCTLVTGLIGAGTAVYLTRRVDGKHAVAAQPKKTERIKLIHSLGELTVNLADPAEMRYVRVGLSLGLGQKLEEEVLHRQEPALRDTIIEVLSSKRYEDLHGPGGPAKLKKELLQAISLRMPELELREIYLEGFVMQ